MLPGDAPDRAAGGVWTMEFLRQLVRGVVDAWQRLSASARINLVLASLVTVSLIVGLVVLGARPQYVSLYTGLDAEDSAAIQGYLTENGVPFRVGNNGATVLVPASELTTVRTGLAGEGLPARFGGGPGFELFEAQDIMANRYLQDITYLRAINGELQRLINQFNFVRSSVVMIREADEALFREEEKPSEASILLDVKRELTPLEVDTIVHIVSAFGGANLSPNYVTVATTSGRTLHKPSEDGEMVAGGTKQELVRGIEREREERIRADLREMGYQNAVVRVSAEVDFRETKQTKTEVSKGAPISTFETRSRTTVQDALPEGPPGARQNLPETAVAAAGVQTLSDTSETIENLEPSTTTIEMISPPGTEITGWSVSAIVEGEYTEGEDGEMSYVGLSEEQRTALLEHIASAVSPTIEPEDVALSDMPFPSREAVAAGLAAPTAFTVNRVVQWLQENIGRIIMALMVVVGIFWVRRLLRRSIEAVTPAEEFAEETHVSPEDLRRREVATQLQQASQEQPQTVAALLRTWMSESEE